MTNTLKPYRSEQERSQGQEIGYAQGVEGHSAGLSGVLSHNLAVACFGIIKREPASDQDEINYSERACEKLRTYSRGDTLLGYEITDPTFADMLIEAIRDEGASMADVINLLVIASGEGLAVKKSSRPNDELIQEFPAISISMN